VMMRRADANEAPYRYNEDFKFAEDYELWVRMSERYRLANFPEVLYRYRRHRGTIGARERSMQPRITQKVQIRCLSRLGIVPTQSEIELHAQIANYQYRPEKDFAEAACEWFDRILDANVAHGTYNQETLRRYLDRRRTEITRSIPQRRPFFKRIFHR
jgi:hypothetical protein